MRIKLTQSIFVVLQLCIFLPGSLASDCVQYATDSAAVEFNNNPGVYEPANLQETSCSSACSSSGYPYAGLTEGKYCFCSSTSTGGASSACNLNCPANADTCGGIESTFSVSSVVAQSGACCSHVSSSQAITVSTNRDTDESAPVGVELSKACSFDICGYSVSNYGIFQIDSAESFLVTWYFPGVYTVTWYGFQSGSPLSEVSTQKSITVNSAMSSLNAPYITFSCPETVNRSVEFICIANVWRGEGNIIFKVDGVSSSPKNTGRKQMLTVGTPDPTVPYPLMVTQGVSNNEIFALSTTIKHSRALLLGFEFHCSNLGNMDVTVLAPACPASAYCKNSQACNESTCAKTPDFQCSGTWCTMQGACVGSTCPSSVSSTSVIKKFAISPSNLGYNFYRLEEPLFLEYGYFLSYESSDGCLSAFYAAEMSDIKSSGTSTVVRHALRAVISVPTTVAYPVNFTQSGLYSVNVTFTDDYSRSLTTGQAVNVQSQVILITGTTIHSSAVFANTAESVKFNVSFSTGSDISVTFQFGDGSSNETSVLPVAERSTFYSPVSHVFTAAGSYVVTVYAVNEASAEKDSVTVYIQNPVIDGSFQFEFSYEQFSVYTSVKPFPTNVSCEMDLGDGTKIPVNPEEIGASLTFDCTHTYNSTGQFILTINIYNDVSSVTIKKQVEIDIRTTSTTEPTTTEMSTTSTTTEAPTTSTTTTITTTLQTTSTTEAPTTLTSTETSNITTTNESTTVVLTTSTSTEVPTSVISTSNETVTTSTTIPSTVGLTTSSTAEDPSSTETSTSVEITSTSATSTKSPTSTTANEMSTNVTDDKTLTTAEVTNSSTLIEDSNSSQSSASSTDSSTTFELSSNETTELTMDPSSTTGISSTDQESTTASVEMSTSAGEQTSTEVTTEKVQTSTAGLLTTETTQLSSTTAEQTSHTAVETQSGNASSTVDRTNITESSTFNNVSTSDSTKSTTDSSTPEITSTTGLTSATSSSSELVSTQGKTDSSTEVSTTLMSRSEVSTQNASSVGSDAGSTEHTSSPLTSDETTKLESSPSNVSSVLTSTMDDSLFAGNVSSTNLNVTSSIGNVKSISTSIMSTLVTGVNISETGSDSSGLTVDANSTAVRTSVATTSSASETTSTTDVTSSTSEETSTLSVHTTSTSDLSSTTEVATNESAQSISSTNVTLQKTSPETSSAYTNMSSSDVTSSSAFTLETLTSQQVNLSTSNVSLLSTALTDNVTASSYTTDTTPGSTSSSNMGRSTVVGYSPSFSSDWNTTSTVSLLDITMSSNESLSDISASNTSLDNTAESTSSSTLTSNLTTALFTSTITSSSSTETQTSEQTSSEESLTSDESNAISSSTGIESSSMKSTSPDSSSSYGSSANLTTHDDFSKTSSLKQQQSTTEESTSDKHTSSPKPTTAPTTSTKETTEQPVTKSTVVESTSTTIRQTTTTKEPTTTKKIPTTLAPIELSVDVLMKDFETSEMRGGFGSMKNVYLVGHPITFKVSAVGIEMVETFNLSVHNGENLMVSSENVFNYNFSQPGKYDLILDAETNEDVVIRAVYFALEVQKQIETFKVSHETYHGHLEKPQVFTIACESCGADSCAKAEFGDRKIQFFGVEEECDKLFNTDEGTYGRATLYDGMEIVHTYYERNSYVVTVTVSNVFQAELSSSIKLIIGREDCSLLKVWIDNNSTQLENTKPVFASEEIILYSKSLVSCVNPKQHVHRKWIVYDLNDTKNEIDVVKSTFSELTIPAHTLGSNRCYIVYYHVEILDVVPAMKESGSTYLCTINANVKAKLFKDDATKMVLGENQTFVISPALYSVDPEVKDSETNNLTVVCFCKQSGESYPVDLNSVNTIVPGHDPIYDSTVPSSGGCFGRGPGTFNMNDEFSVKLNTLNFVRVEQTYEIACVVISKYLEQPRTSVARLELEIVPGIIPTLNMKCKNLVSEQGAVVNFNTLVSCTVECSSECNVEKKINLDVIQIINGVEEAVSAESFIKATKISSTKVQFNIDPAIFNSSISPDAEYITYRMQMQGDSSDNGEVAMAARINRSPTGGSCEVHLGNDTLRLQLQYVISCDDKWFDPEGDPITTYKFYSISQLGRGENVYGETDRRRAEFYFLPDDRYDFFVAIKDKHGAVVNVPLASNVTTPSSDDLTNMAEFFKNLKDTFFSEGNNENIPNNIILSELAAERASMEKPDYLDESVNDPAYSAVISNERMFDTLKSVQDQGVFNRGELSTMLKTMTTLLGTRSTVTEDNFNDIVKYVDDGLSNQQAIKPDKLDTSIKEASEVKLEMDAIAKFISKTLEPKVIEGLIPNLDEDVSKIFGADHLSDYTGEYMIEENNEKIVERSSRKQSQMIDKLTDYQRINFANSAAEKLEVTENHFHQIIERVYVQDLNHSIFKDPMEIACGIERQPEEPCNTDRPVIVQIVTTTRQHTHEKGGGELVNFNSHTVDAVISDLDGKPLQVSVKKYDTGRNKRSLQNQHDKIDRYPIEVEIKLTDDSDSMERIVPVLRNEQTYLNMYSNIDNAESFMVLISPVEKTEHMLLAFNSQRNPSFTNSTEEDLIVKVIDMDTEIDDNGTVVYKKLFSKSDYPFLFENPKKEGDIYVTVAQLFNSTDIDTVDLKNLSSEDLVQDMNSFDYMFVAIFCSYFDNAVKEWKVDGLQVLGVVGDVVSGRTLICGSTHLTVFGSGFFVKPNTIDFDYVFENADINDNLTIYLTVSISFALYLILVVWARWQDKKDVRKLGACPLPDNNVNDKYLYEIMVFTGSKTNSATDSKVSFVLSGSNGESDVRSLEDTERKIFQTSSVDCFIMTTPRPLGNLNYLRIWHDNSGKGKRASWYVDFVVVRDVQTGKKYEFIAHRWFAVELDDGAIDRMLPVSGKDELSEFSHLFTTQSSRNLRDGHLWLSIFLRPPRSRFTRVQRLSSCMALLYLAMLVNIMWYGTAPDKPTSGLNIGPFSLSPAQIGIGVMANLIVFPPSLIIIMLFRKSRPRILRPSRVTVAIEKQKNRKNEKGDKCSDDEDDGDDEPDDHSGGETVAANSGDDVKPSSPSGSQVNLVENNDDSDKPSSSSVRKQKCERSKKFTFPWWCVYVAWFLTAACIGVSLFFLWAYGIQFGNEKTTKWFTSLIISTLCSIFLTQPIKVMLGALFLSMICKNIDQDEDDADEDEEDPELAEDEEWLHSEFIRRKRKAPKILNTKQMQSAREQREKEIKMYAIAKEIFAYFMFLWILLTLSYGNRDPNAIHMRQNMHNVLLKPGDLKIDFYKYVKSTGKLYEWIKGGFLPEIIVQEWYNKAPPMSLGGYLDDRTNFFIGFPIIRQVRVKENSCKVDPIVENITRNCGGYGNLINEDHRDYREGWRADEDRAAGGSRYEFRYQTATTLKSLPFWGKLDWYGGGGYVFPLIHPLRGKLKIYDRQIDRLRDNDWIDKSTRAVFFEFSVYNAQVNLFATVTIVAEFQPGGGIIPYNRIDVLRLQRYHTGFGLFIMICEVLFMVFVIYYTVHEMRLAFVQRRTYLRYVANCLNFGIVLLSWTAFGLFIQREVMTRTMLQTFAESKGRGYVRLQHVAAVDEVLGYFISFLVFLGNLKFLTLLRFNKRLGILSATLKECASDLSSFAVCLLIVFLAFVQLFYLVLGLHMADYATFINAIEATFSMMLGKFNFKQIRLVSPFLGPLVFFVFGLATSLVLINILLTIVIRTFEEVKRDMSRLPNEYEMVEFILNRVRSVMGLQRKHKVSPEEVERTFKVRDREVDDFPEKVEKLLTYINDVYFDGIDGGGGGGDYANKKTKMRKPKISRASDVHQ